MYYIDPELPFMELATKYGWQSSTYVAVLQFKVSDLKSDLICPMIQLLPGYSLNYIISMQSACTHIRIYKSRRAPMKYKMKIWFNDQKNYSFHFNTSTVGRSLQQIFYDLASEGYVQKRVVNVEENLPVSIEKFATLELLEEVERRYKTNYPDWAKAINQKSSKAVPIRKIA